MKLRLLDNTLRLRLTQSEVTQIGRGKSIGAHTDFANGRLDYQLTVTSDTKAAATFADGCITLSLPQAAVQTWSVGDQVSIRADIDTSNGTSLSLLIEKDFNCRAPDANRRAADDKDTFPHPADDPNGQ